MTQQQQFRWQPSRQQVLRRGGLVLGIAFLVIVFGGYVLGWEWTGLTGLGPAEPKQRTFWDWLELLIVPVVLAIGGAWLNSEQKDREQYVQDQGAQHDAFQKYVDYISKAIIDEKLYRASDDSLKEARITIRAQTLAVLTRLTDPYRKASVLQFIYEAGLINGEDAFLSLLGANLQGVNLSRIGSTLESINLRYASLNEAILVNASMRNAYLYGADLTGADLTGADLRGINLTNAKLRGVYLWNAKLGTYEYEDDYGETSEIPTKLHNADLTGARLDGATGIANEELEKQASSVADATMPDGSKHD